MTPDTEVHEFLMRHLNAILENDVEMYHATTHEELTLYEWWVTPHRIEGIPFHDFMIESNAKRGTVFGAETEGESTSDVSDTRFDLANLKIQRYGDTAIASYTMLVSTATQAGVEVASHNESRVLIKMDHEWRVVHVHKSPAYKAPHVV